MTSAAALARRRPLLFHATAYGAWPSIVEHGLQSAATLAVSAGHPPFTRVRAEATELSVPGVGGVRIRDQRTMARVDLDAHLDGVTLPEWLALVNDRVFLFARQNDLTILLARYQAEGQDVVVFDTARLLVAADRRVEVTTVATGAPPPRAGCACRGRNTFVPLTAYAGDVADIADVTVVGDIADVSTLVQRVVRHHPDRASEVLVAR